MTSIMNIKLNNTSKNPSIHIMVLILDASKLIHTSREKKMNTSTHNSRPHLAVAEGTSSNALASLLLAAGVAALVVLADQLLDSWAERHEMAAWLVLWGIAVVAIAGLRGASRMAARQTVAALDGWSARLAQRRADERLWSMAQSDARLMSDLQSALDRSDSPAQDVVDLTQRRAARILRDRLYSI
jgi:hypothetical protein